MMVSHHPFSLLAASGWQMAMWEVVGVVRDSYCLSAAEESNSTLGVANHGGSSLAWPKNRHLMEARGPAKPSITRSQRAKIRCRPEYDVRRQTASSPGHGGLPQIDCYLGVAEGGGNVPLHAAARRETRLCDAVDVSRWWWREAQRVRAAQRFMCEE
jgi:hypothetical protein